MKAGFECDLKLQETKNRFFKEIRFQIVKILVFV